MIGPERFVKSSRRDAATSKTTMDLKSAKAQKQRRAAALLHGKNETFRSSFGRSLIASLEPMMCAAGVAPSGRGN